MPRPQVIAIDPAPSKRSTVFDGEGYSHLTDGGLRDYVNLIASERPGTLVCWDVPLTGPADRVRAGSFRYDFTKRSIERFFSIESTGFKTPNGISVLGYRACPHWTISRSLRTGACLCLARVVHNATDAGARTPTALSFPAELALPSAHAQKEGGFRR